MWIRDGESLFHHIQNLVVGIRDKNNFGPSVETTLLMNDMMLELCPMRVPNVLACLGIMRQAQGSHLQHGYDLYLQT